MLCCGTFVKKEAVWVIFRSHSSSLRNSEKRVICSIQGYFNNINLKMNYFNIGGGDWGINFNINNNKSDEIYKINTKYTINEINEIIYQQSHCDKLSLDPLDTFNDKK